MTAEFHPLVSIVIPVYNGVDFVAEAIECALAQTYDNIEILVINDGSVDGSEMVVRRYEPRIRYFFKPNGGVSSALNLAIANMRGEYFAWLSHDDLFYPEKTACEVAALRELTDKNTIIVSNWDTIDADGAILQRQGRMKLGGSMLVDLLVGSPIHGCAALIPRKCFDECGGFSVEKSYVSDVQMFFRLGFKFPYHVLERSLVAARLHGKQIGVLRKPQHLDQCNWFLIEGLRSLPENLIPAAYDDFYGGLALNWNARGYFAAAREARGYLRRRSGAFRLRWLKSSFAVRFSNFKKRVRRWVLK